MASFRSQDCPRETKDDEVTDTDSEVVLDIQSAVPIYSRTLGDLQIWLSRSGKDLSSMNVDEFLNTVCAAQENPPAVLAVVEDQVTNEEIVLPNDQFRIPENLCCKTVEEVLADLQYNEDEDEAEGEILVPVVQTTTNMDVVSPKDKDLGEMTLEEFLVRAGIVREQPLPPPHFFYGPNFTPASSHGVQGQPSGVRSGVIVNGNMELQPAAGSPDSLERINMLKGRKRCINDPPDKLVVERRQIRMIKNRESAARSRARKQAYTDELEQELKQLTRENLRLRKALAKMEREKRDRLRQQQQRDIEEVAESEDEDEMGIKSQRIQEKLKATRRTPSCSG